MNFEHVNKELFEQVKNLVIELEPIQNHSIGADKIRLLFNLHNKVYWRNMEHSTGCASCRQRTWNRLRTWYYENKERYEQMD